MIRKTIEISSGPVRLSVEHRQLVIERPENGKATVPIEDIGVLIVDQQRASYTHSVFSELLDVGAAVILCGANHHPAGVFLPIDAHSTQTERHRWQVEASQPFKKRAWAQVIRAKIRQQGAVLAHANGKDEGLSKLAGRVRSGDPDNLEAQAAQRYWKALFGKDFRRSREGGGANSPLNYGYAVLRAAVARAVAGSGLIPSLGLHHRHRSNPFCLADDLMEPYRPFVDIRVRELARAGHDFVELDRDAKAALLSVLNETISIGDRRTPVGLAVHQTTASLARSLEAGRPALDLPSSLFIRQSELELANDGGSGDRFG